VVYLKVRMSEFVCTSEQEIVIMRYVGIQEFTCFHPFCPFHPEITISRSLEGKYTFLGGICCILGQEARNSDLGRIGVPKGEFLNSDMTHNHDYCSEVYTNSGLCTFRGVYDLLVPPDSLSCSARHRARPACGLANACALVYVAA